MRDKKMSDQPLNQLCEAGAGFYARGYVFGSTGNLSVRIGDRIWITPTGQSLKSLTPGELACLDAEAKNHNANKPSKEAPFHLAVYRRRPDVNAIVHLHAPDSVALSCLEAPEEIPPLTPYYFMRVAPLAVLPYFRPGSAELAEAVEQAAPAHNCMLLRNHGTICAGATLNEAVDRAEELEATARLYFTLRGERVRHLTAEQIEELRRVFGRK
jgi:ribulose-5-phosphate 4-epimerase/fuculose-1-phosphate aldolase